ncbi:MAG: peptidyl-alpha-hydroxyglycine alpha-amidating lyase family protein [Planctomycetota bacterium]
MPISRLHAAKMPGVFRFVLMFFILTFAAHAIHFMPIVKVAAAADEGPVYEPITLSTWYKVDPTWPRRPDHCQWDHIPGVAVDAKDQVWIFTRGTPPVQVYDSDGNFIRAWGTDLIGTKDGRKTSHQIKIDQEGMIWLADTGKHVVMRLTPEGKLLQTLGTPNRPGNDASHFNMPTDMAIRPDGHVFVADGYVNSRVVHFDEKGNFVNAWGSRGTEAGQFSLVHAIALDSQGNVYVADRNNARVQVFNSKGKFLDQWQDIVIPWGFCMTEDDELWVCGCSPMPWEDPEVPLSCPPRDQVFMRFNPSGKLLQLWTIPKAKDGQEQPGELNWVHGIALDSEGNIYATDIIGQRVQKFVKQN